MTKSEGWTLMIVSMFTLFSLNCKKNPVAPPPPPPPDGNDTTSNNFTFQTYTFGGNAGSCVLSDVSIISPTDIWAVGAVYLDSASGAPDPFPYNAAHWDGQKWNLQKIPYNYQGQAFYSPINSILAFTSSDIWFEFGIHWDGNIFNSIPLNISFPSHANKMWGSSSNDFYIVGNSGLIAHYTNGAWTKTATGTSLSFYDIYGSNGQILAVASDVFTNTGRTIVQINGVSAATISTYPIAWSLQGIWFVPNQQYYIVGDGIYQKNSLTDSTWNNGPLDITRYGTTSVRGNGINDVFIVGAYGEFLHWNGVRSKSFIDQTGLTNGSYASVAVNKDLVVAVGGNNAQAVITMGTRQ
jgi:hypothetical protein